MHKDIRFAGAFIKCTRVKNKDRRLFEKFKLIVPIGASVVWPWVEMVEISQNTAKFLEVVNMQIVEDLWQVGGAGFTSEEDAAIFLIRFGPEAALIDAGCGRAHRRLVDNVAEVLPAGVNISYLLLTHCHFDHTGGAEAARKQYGCRIAAHSLDAVYLQDGNSQVTAASWYRAQMPILAVDEIFSDSPRVFEVGSGKIRAQHCPGHTPGSVVYIASLQSQTILFGQDIHGPLHASFFSDQADYRRSLEKLLELRADILCEGHFGVFRGKGQVEKFIRSYL